MRFIKNIIAAIDGLTNPYSGELAVVQGVLALSVSLFLLLCTSCILYALYWWVKTYRQKGHLQRKMVTLILLFIIGCGIFYFLDRQIYLRGLAPVWIYPHQTLPLNVHPAYYRNQQYFLEENQLTSMYTSPTLVVETFKSPSFLVYKPSPEKSYQALTYQYVDRDTTILIETMLSYGYNATDFVICVQDTIGKQYWLQVLPDKFLYHLNSNDSSIKKQLQLNYKYLLLPENETLREYYHWINLHKTSFLERTIDAIVIVLWLVLLTLFFPIMSIWGIVVFIKLIVEKCRQRNKTPLIGTSD